VHTLDIAPLRSESPPQKRSGMARVLKGFHKPGCLAQTQDFRFRNCKKSKFLTKLYSKQTN